MANQLHKKFIGGVAAAAIAITSISAATTAQAGDRDTEKALAALLGLAVIGAVIADKKKDDRAVTSTRDGRVYHTHRNGTQHSHRGGAERHRHGYGNGHGQVIFDRHGHRHGHVTTVRPRPLPRRVERPALPQECLRQFRTDRGPWRIYTQRCMNRSYKQVNALPRACERVVRTDRGRRVGWGAQCLHERGYRMARR